MAEVRIPEEFLDALEVLKLPPEETFKLIRWASANPDKVAKFLEVYGKLNRAWKKRVKYHLFVGDPVDELEFILERQMKERDAMSVYMKTVHAAKKGGFSFTTKAGVKGFLKVDGSVFHFKFDVQGVEVELVCYSPSACTVKSIIEGDVEGEFGEIYVEGKRVSSFDPACGKVAEAIKNNVNPYVMLAVG
jgi:hypothetical protein